MGINDRTNRLVEAFVPMEQRESRFKFDDFVVGISVGRKLADTIAGQVMVLTAVNILGRFTRKVVLVTETPVSRRIRVPRTQSEQLSTALFEFSRSIDTVLSLQHQKSFVGRLDALVKIGSSDLASPFTLSINSNGWIAELSYDSDLDYITDDPNPIGPEAAATLAGAEVFKEILRRLGSRAPAIQKKLPDVLFSTLEFSANGRNPANPKLPKQIDLGNIFLVGAGAVGSSFVYSLGNTQGLSGRLTIIDFDTVDKTNLNRYLAAGLPDIGRPKVDVASEFLEVSGFRVFPMQMSYETFVKTEPYLPLDLVVSTVDNGQAREHIQSDLPREILHGATHEQTFAVSRHDFINGACLGCLFFRQPKPYSEQVADETGISLEEVERVLGSDGPFTTEHVKLMVEKKSVSETKYAQFVGRSFKDVYAKEICGTIEIRVANKTEAATASFVSAMPGILLAGEVLKARIPELSKYRLSNYLQMSLFSPGAGMLMFRKKDPRCTALCGEAIMINRYRQKWLAARSTDPDSY